MLGLSDYTKRGIVPGKLGLLPRPGWGPQAISAPGPGSAADWTARGDPAVSRDEIGSRWAACTPALALYAEPPAGPLTMGGASAPVLGPS